MNPNHKLVLQKQFVFIVVLATALLSFYFILELLKTFFIVNPSIAYLFEKCIRFIGNNLSRWFTLPSIVSLVVILGSFFGLLFFVYQLVRTKRFILSLSIISLVKTRLSFQKLIGKLQLQKQVCIVDSNEKLCFCAGTFNPKIYISNETIKKLNINELQAILTHEKHHLDHKSPLKMIILRLISGVFFYIPVLKELSNHYLILDEIQADNKVMNYPSGKLHLAQAFYKFADAPKRKSQYLTTTFIENTPDAIEIRITRLSDVSIHPELNISVPTLLTNIVFFIAITIFVHTHTPLHAQETQGNYCKNQKTATSSQIMKKTSSDTIWKTSSTSLDK